MVQLIRAAVPIEGGTWAELGAGTGNFTRALCTLLGPGATIIAVDRDTRALASLRTSFEQAALAPTLQTLTADFTRPLDLPPLDGLLMANSLHFVRDQEATLEHVVKYLRPGGRFVLVEYDFRLPRPWVPFPISASRWPDVAAGAGLFGAEVIGNRRSRTSGVIMYAGAASKPT